MKNHTIAVIQLRLDQGPEQNLAKCQQWVTKAAKAGATILCLPELCASHYFCQDEDHRHFELAEPLGGRTFQLFAEQARELGVVIVAPFFERRMAGVYHNSAYTFDADGSQAGLYRKMHIPDDPHFYEKFYFTPGDLGFRSAATRHGHVGTLICWDQWYPEAARLTALQGAEVLFYPTAIGWLPPEKEQYGQRQLDAWMGAMKGHAVCNGLYVGAANRIGHEPSPDGGDGIEFWGHSFIAGPQGEILAQASADQEEILMAELDRAHLETVRQHWPFYRDRRIDAYEAITQRSLLP
ncbi:MAG: carbon-nitrogen hydrolase [Limisphaerales bacterium]|jgi:N-carbamoylputrescine amidase